jgi:hypothetical protein
MDVFRLVQRYSIKNSCALLPSSLLYPLRTVLLSTLSVATLSSLVLAQDAEISDIRSQLSSMRALSGPEDISPVEQQAELDAVARKLAEAEARLMEKVSALSPNQDSIQDSTQDSDQSSNLNAALQRELQAESSQIDSTINPPSINPPAADFDMPIAQQSTENESIANSITEIENNNIASNVTAEIKAPSISAIENTLNQDSKKLESTESLNLIPTNMREQAIAPERAIPEIIIPQSARRELQEATTVSDPTPKRAVSTKPKAEVEIKTTRQNANSVATNQIDSQALNLVRSEKARINEQSKLTQKFADAQAEIIRLKRELQASKNRLMIAETEVERLSSIVEVRNKASLARYVPESSKQAPAPTNRRPAPQKAAIKNQEQKNSRTVIVRTAEPNRAAESTPDDMPIATVIADKANLRTGPGEDNSPIITVAKGTRLAVETREGKWFRVTSPTGTRAWVSSDVVAFNVSDKNSSLSTVRVKGYDPEAAEKAFGLQRSRSK